MRPRVFPWVGLAAAAALVAIRAWPFMRFEAGNFDSDQALFGLMAKHIAELKHFPLFPYAQSHILVLESWLAAPLFVILPHTVAVLKLPLLLMNLAVAGLLLYLARTELKLQPTWTWFAVLWFLIPAPVVSSRLVASSGGNIEPFLFVLLIWTLRGTRWCAGVIAGIGLLNREFVLYGVLAFGLVESSNYGVRATLKKHWPKLLAMIVTIAVVRSVHRLTPYYVGGGPHLTFHLHPARMWDAATWVVTRQIPLLLGLKSGFYASFDIPGQGEEVSATWVRWTIGLGSAAVALRTLWLARRNPSQPRNAEAFAFYLMAVALLSVLSFLVLAPDYTDPLLFRYNLVFLFFPIGLWLLYFHREHIAWARWAGAGVVGVWALSSFLHHAELNSEFFRNPPVSAFRTLERALDEQGVTVGEADYWTAYTVSFLTDERIQLAVSTGVRRVADYQILFEQTLADAPSRARTILGGTCPEGIEGVTIDRWCVAPVQEQ